MALVTITRRPRDEAILLCGRLQADGIAAVHNPSGAPEFPVYPFGGAVQPLLEIAVPEREAERARELLATLENESPARRE